MITLKHFVPITLNTSFSYNVPPRTCVHFCKSPLKFRTYAQNGGTKRDSNDDGNGSKKDRFAGFSFRWGDLLNPDKDNFLAVGLAGVLTWASLQVLSQLFFISFAILVAALKYTFIAALLIFTLVTLL